MRVSKSCMRVAIKILGKERSQLENNTKKCIQIFNRNRVSTYTIQNSHLDHSASHSGAAVQKTVFGTVVA